MKISNKNDVFLPPAKEVWGKVIFLHLSVILFTGGSASVYGGIPISPREQTPPRADTLRSRHSLELGADTPWSRHPPRAGTPRSQEQTPTPLCSACWKIRSTSGRYASYWNANLFVIYSVVMYEQQHW